MRINNLVTFIILCLSIQTVSAQTSGLQFLNIGFGSRACGMGEAFTSLADDASGTYWNPAGVGISNRDQFLFSHHGWLAQTTCDYLSGVVSFSNSSAIGINLIYLSYGDIEGRDEYGYKIDNYSAYDLAFALSYSRLVMKNLSVGLTGKAVQSSIEKEKGTGFSGDAGLLYQAPVKGLKIGLVLQHFGTGLRYIDVVTKFPTTVRWGMSYEIPVTRATIIPAVDFLKEVSGDYLINGGIEVMILDEFFLRSGYKINSPQGGLTAGCGVVEKVYSFQLHIDYAYSLYGDLGRIHRVSVGVEF